MHRQSGVKSWVAALREKDSQSVQWDAGLRTREWKGYSDAIIQDMAHNVSTDGSVDPDWFEPTSFWEMYWMYDRPWKNPEPVDTVDRVLIGVKWGGFVCECIDLAAGGGILLARGGRALLHYGDDLLRYSDGLWNYADEGIRYLDNLLSKPEPTLYWHGSAFGVTRRNVSGIFVDGPGNGRLFWATSKQIDELGIFAWRIGGNRNVRLWSPGLLNKGGLEATYTLLKAASAVFRRAWGFEFNWNVYQWWKGAAGQYYYRAGSAMWGQRLGELGKALGITGSGIGGAWGWSELFGD